MVELRTACPGWKDPLPHAVKRKVINPFTNESLEIMTTAPDPADPFEPGAAVHANLAPLHRVDLKGLGTVEMENLVRVVLDGPELEAADSALRPTGERGGHLPHATGPRRSTRPDES